MEFKKVITNKQQLQDILGEPGQAVLNKSISIIDKHCAKFIAHSPFLTIASSDAAGNVDVSPKGNLLCFKKIHLCSHSQVLHFQNRLILVSPPYYVGQ